jgi:hypothetical protein
MDKRDRAALWTLIWVLSTFKIVTVLMIVIMLPGEGTIKTLLATHVAWFAGAAVLISIPAMFWYRLVKVRARRKRLIWQEWNVKPEPAPQESPEAPWRW